MRAILKTVFALAALNLAACSRDEEPKTAPEPAVTSDNTLHDIGSVSSLTLQSEKVTLDLRQTPQANQWGTNSCHTYLPLDMVLGQATCHDKPELTAVISAANVYQVCTDSEIAALAPQTAIEIEGCAGGLLDIAVFHLDPDLKITIAR